MFIPLHLKSTENLEIKPLENTRAPHCVTWGHSLVFVLKIDLLSVTRVGKDLQRQLPRQRWGQRQRGAQHMGSQKGRTLIPAVLWALGKITKVRRSRWGPWPVPGQNHQSTVLTETYSENDFQRSPFIIMERDLMKVSFTKVWSESSEPRTMGFQTQKFAAKRYARV